MKRQDNSLIISKNYSVAVVLVDSMKSDDYRREVLLQIDGLIREGSLELENFDGPDYSASIVHHQGLQLHVLEQTGVSNAVVKLMSVEPLEDDAVAISAEYQISLSDLAELVGLFTDCHAILKYSMQFLTRVGSILPVPMMD